MKIVEEELDRMAGGMFANEPPPKHQQKHQQKQPSITDLINDIRAYAKVSLIMLSLISVTNIIIAIKLIVQ